MLRTERPGPKRRASLVGVTGGMGSGKTTVARILADCGAGLIDADLVGHAVLAEHADTRRRILERFGADVQDANGNINRRLLGRRAFGEDGGVTDLNRIMHPVMIHQIADAVRTLLRSRKYPMIVVDAALIFEAGGADRFDYILAVTAPETERIQRVMRRTGSSEDAVRLRMVSQIPESEKAHRAQFVLHNAGSLADVQTAARTLFQSILQRFQTGGPLP